MLELPHPILTNDELAKLRATSLRRLPRLHPADALPVPPGGTDAGRGRAARRARRALPDASRAIADGASILILSDRGVGRDTGADPEPARRGARCTTT